MKGTVERKELYSKLRVLSNAQRFHILELTQDEELSIAHLSSKLGLAYTKCADYVQMLHKSGLVSKRKEGREVLIHSRIKLEENGVKF